MLEHIYHTIRGRTKWTTDPRIKFQRPLIGCKTLHVYVYIYILFLAMMIMMKMMMMMVMMMILMMIYTQYVITYGHYTIYIDMNIYIYIYQSHIRVSASIYLRIWYSLFERSMGICINHMSIYVVSFLTHICIYIYISFEAHTHIHEYLHIIYNTI